MTGSGPPAIPLDTRKARRGLSSPRTKTITPTLESARTSRSPTPDTADEGDEVDQLEVQHGASESNLSDNGDDRQLLLGKGVKEGPSRKATRSTWVTILGVKIPTTLMYLLALPLLIALLGIYRLSGIVRYPPKILLSNGTHSYHPTTILLSLDGFRPSYLVSHPDLLQNMLSLANSSFGLRAEYMTPVFPTLTFPNHWALMTGLYPAWSGIVANDFWAPDMERGDEFTRPGPVKATGKPDDSKEPEAGDGEWGHGEKSGKQFIYTNPDKSWDSGWWWGEPLWGVAERGGRKAANLMWPGPPVTSKGAAPSFFVPYRGKIDPSAKLSQILAWLDHPFDNRPELITAYFPDVDQSGHSGGPVSPQVDAALSRVDEMVGGLITGLEERNLTSIVDVVIVSDHGMASTSNERLIYLDDVLQEDGYAAIAHRDGWPCVGLRFKAGSDVPTYHQRLIDAAAASDGAFAVYTHETMLDRWHFGGNDRIAPIYVVPALGWALTDHHEHEVEHEGDYRPKGNHGYDNKYEEMRAIFMAHGPFAAGIKSGRGADAAFVQTDPHVMKNFMNLEIYSLVLRLLGLQSLEPPHNGTVGFWDTYLD